MSIYYSKIEKYFKTMIFQVIFGVQGLLKNVSRGLGSVVFINVDCPGFGI